MILSTNNDWSGLKRILALCVVAWIWSYGTYSASFPLEHFRAAGLALLASGVCLFLYWVGKLPCMLWRCGFGDSLGVTLFEKIVTSLVPIWFVAFPPLLTNGAVGTFGIADAIFALVLFFVMVDFGGYQSALFYKVIEGRIELSFREVGLDYPPKSKLATFIVFGFFYVIVAGLILKF